MVIISAWLLRTSSKFTREEVKRQPESLNTVNSLADEDDSPEVKRATVASSRVGSTTFRRQYSVLFTNPNPK